MLISEKDKCPRLHRFLHRFGDGIQIIISIQKQFHSRYNFGYGILLYMRKMPTFCPLTPLFGGFEGVFSYKTDKSAFACPDKTEVADFVRLRVKSFKE